MITYIFFSRVSIVKSQDEFAIVMAGIVIIEQCRFNVAYMKITTRLGRKARHNFALHSSI